MAKIKYDNGKCQEVECDAYYDFTKDIVYVKVRRVVKDPETGRLMKKGLMFKVTEEMLEWIAEGQAYVIRTPDRWEQIIEEIPERE